MSVSPHDNELKSDAAFESLLGKVEPRPKPPKSHEHAVRQVVHAEWRLATRRRRRRRWTLLSVAAGLVLAVTTSVTVLQPWRGGIVLDSVATVEKRVGDVTISGESVVTGKDSYVSLALVSGGSLRLDANTRIEIEAEDRIYLATGSVYFDSSPAVLARQQFATLSVSRLELRTDTAMISPLGTRYLTRIDGDTVIVRVREGAVVVDGSGFETTAATGQQLLLRGFNVPTVSAITSYGDAWAWIEKTSPPIETEGRTIYEFLDWVGRESGRTLRFGTEAAEQLARSSTIVGYGRMDLEPSVALRVVMLSTDLNWRIDDGDIVVFERPLSGFNRRI